MLAATFAVEWVIYFLWRLGVLRVLEYSSFISVMFGVLTWYNEAPDRKKQKHYQAWQVINTAQGKGGNGGRIEAMQELNADKIPLVGVDVSGSFLQGVKLPKAELLRADFEGSDLRDCMLEGAHLNFANFKSANFRGGDLHGARLKNADLESADLYGTNLTEADFTSTNLRDVDFRYADLKGIQWDDIRSIEDANIYGVKNAPPGFVEWALKHKAISNKDAE
jgi:uncharacterized protein YjbI with pentapeptide repeats